LAAICANKDVYIVINDKSQGSIAKHLSYDGLLHYEYIIQFPGERIFKIGEHCDKVTGKTVDCVIHPYTPFADSEVKSPR